MKTYFSLFTFLLLSLIALTSCKNNGYEKLKIPQKKILLFEFPVDELLINLSDNSSDSSFLKAIRIINETKNDTIDFITQFYSVWNNIEPNGRLSKIFGTYDLRERIAVESTNDWVISVLRDKEYDIIVKISEILKQKLIKSRVDFNMCKNEGKFGFEVTIREVNQAERLVNLLQEADGLPVKIKVSIFQLKG